MHDFPPACGVIARAQSRLESGGGVTVRLVGRRPDERFGGDAHGPEQREGRLHAPQQVESGKPGDGTTKMGQQSFQRLCFPSCCREEQARGPGGCRVPENGEQRFAACPEPGLEPREIQKCLEGGEQWRRCCRLWVTGNRQLVEPRVGIDLVSGVRGEMRQFVDAQPEARRQRCRFQEAGIDFGKNAQARPGIKLARGNDLPCPLGGFPLDPQRIFNLLDLEPDRVEHTALQLQGAGVPVDAAVFHERTGLSVDLQSHRRARLRLDGEIIEPRFGRFDLSTPDAGHRAARVGGERVVRR